MRAARVQESAQELFRDAAFPATESSLFFNLSTPLAQFREDITWRRPQVGLGAGLLPEPGGQAGTRNPRPAAKPSGGLPGTQAPRPLA